jgi:hypothetical protein
MTSYIARLRAEIAQTHPPYALTKLTKRNPRAQNCANATLAETFVSFDSAKSRPDGSIGVPYASVFSALESCCPAHVATADWRQAVSGARRFLTQWGEQADALGWTSRDLFGLHKPPDKPAPSYRRLSRYDETGLIWLLRDRPVVALTADTAAIMNSTGNITVYRRHNKPGLGSVGDSLDDLS